MSKNKNVNANPMSATIRSVEPVQFGVITYPPSNVRRFVLNWAGDAKVIWCDGYAKLVK